jgi:hypothetical protein
LTCCMVATSGPPPPWGCFEVDMPRHTPHWHLGQLFEPELCPKRFHNAARLDPYSCALLGCCLLLVSSMWSFASRPFYRRRKSIRSMQLWWMVVFRQRKDLENQTCKVREFHQLCISIPIQIYTYISSNQRFNRNI